MTCAFFGHREVYNRNELVSKLYNTVYGLIEDRGVKFFLVGNNGEFDRLVLEVLRALAKTHNIDYSVVLSYLNAEKDREKYEINETIYPELLETVPLRFAIDRRNRWMISRCDIVVSYINSHIGGAVKYVEICEKRNKEIIALGKI